VSSLTRFNLAWQSKPCEAGPQSAASPRTPLTCYEGKMRPTDVEEIVTAYGAALAEPTALGIVRDVRSLPRSKEDIKTALKTALEVTADVAMRESLKAGYISLADFQQLSDNEVRALQLWNSALSRTDLGTTELVTRLAAEGEAVTAVKLRVVDDAISLAQELKAAGF